MADAPATVGTFAVAVDGKKNKTLSVDIDSHAVSVTDKNGNAEVVVVQRVVREWGGANLVLTVTPSAGSDLSIKFGSPAERELAYLALSKCAIMPSPVADGDLGRALQVNVVTWNMGDSAPPEDLTALVDLEADYDIVAVGVQECNYKPAGGGSCEAHWFGCLEAFLGEHYHRVGGQSMWGIRLIVFIKAELYQWVNNVVISTEATGIAHVAGNKGGVGVRFEVADTSMLFVACHLAAHQGKIAERNSDYSEIINGLNTLSTAGVDVINDSNLVFWCGDLNYRINLERQEALDLIATESWAELLTADQLIDEMWKFNAFVGFTEPPIAFAPTYKYEPGTTEYTAKKSRVPSYCDRVLFTSQAHYDVEPVAYGTTNAILTSDHHPVSAVLAAEMRGPFPITTMEQPACTIRITNLKGAELVAMDSNGFSDPYVKFQSRFLDAGAQTAKVKKTLNPEWADADVPALVPAVSEKEYLLRESLMFVVMDWDKVTKDDIMGQATLALQEYCDGEPHDFELSLRCAGLDAGTLSGTIQVSYGA